MILVILFVKWKKILLNWIEFPHRVPFTKEKIPWCPCPFKNEAHRPDLKLDILLNLKKVYCPLFIYLGTTLLPCGVLCLFISYKSFLHFTVFFLMLKFVHPSEASESKQRQVTRVFFQPLLFSPNFDDQSSLNFHRFFFFCICVEIRQVTRLVYDDYRRYPLSFFYAFWFFQDKQ